MAIATAIIKNNFLEVRDEKGKQLFIKSASTSDAAVLGFTTTSVTLRKAGMIYTYDEKGRQIGAPRAG
ncbi:hypothetical protein [Helicobacter cynogastricus]|uniref:hypothetical protein n=1 Tax=Helicobacter cynogastricus TaxID=329937 RepID=UPI000CF16ED3|nr:hypothetical protein [Helicobacter cynogastricus]